MVCQSRSVPSTVLGLVVFVVSLAPGLAFVLLRERVGSKEKLSPFRETAVVLCVSIAAAVATLAAFAIVRALAPSITPDVGRLVSDPAAYVRTSYVVLFWWGAGLLAVATAGAGLAGAGVLRRVMARVPGIDIDPYPKAHASGVSAWWFAFQDQLRDLPEASVFLDCQLTDGSYVGGYLLSFSTVAEDSGDRELTLAAREGSPITFRPAGARTAEARDGVGAVIVSAAHIRLIFVSYVEA